MDAILPLLPLLLVILIIWYAARRFSKQAGPEVPGPNGETPYGVRGWLAFFVYASMSIGPLIAIGRVNQNMIETETKYPSLLSLDGWGSYKAATWVIVLTLVAWNIWVALQLKNKLVPRSVTHIRVLLVAGPVFTAVADVLAARVFLNVGVVAEVIGGLIGGWAVSAVWLLYFYRSKRVRNTYGLDLPVTPTVAPASARELMAVPGIAPAAHPVPVPAAESRLNELKQLLDRGLISEGDYEAKKQEILARL